MNQMRHIFAVSAALFAVAAIAATEATVTQTPAQVNLILAQQAPGTTAPVITPPPASGPITCPGFANTRVLELTWAAPSRMYTANRPHQRRAVVIRSSAI